MNMHEQPRQTKWHQSRLTWVLLGFTAIGGFFLVTEHTAHFFGILPFLLLLLCPLMMLFMMHGGHSGPSSDGPNQQQPPEGGQP